MLKQLNILVLALLVVIILGLYGKVRKLEAIQMTVDQATELAYGDCRRILSSEKVMSYLLGCHDGLYRACGGQPLCVKSMAYHCSAE